jgi:glutamine phosphoribosylpyrophosphate amidotransferase
MDMSKRITTVKSKVEFKKRTSDEIKRFLDLDTFEYEQIETMVKRTNISFICIHNFSYLENQENHQIISFSGQEWDGKADEILYRDLLEFNLKTK